VNEETPHHMSEKTIEDRISRIELGFQVLAENMVQNYAITPAQFDAIRALIEDYMGIDGAPSEAAPVGYADMTDEQKRMVDAGHAPPAGQFPSGLSRDELVAWMKKRFGTLSSDDAPSAEHRAKADKLLKDTAVEMFTDDGHPDPNAAADELLSQPIAVDDAGSQEMGTQWIPDFADSISNTDLQRMANDPNETLGMQARCLTRLARRRTLLAYWSGKKTQRLTPRAEEPSHD
jgi:hypothetical protein